MPGAAPLLIRVHRRVRGHTSSIHIEAGLMRRLPALLAAGYRGRKLRIITDSTVLGLYGRRLHAYLAALGVDAVALDFPPGEQSKCEDVLRSLQTTLLRHGTDRNALIVALGGGVVGDLAGFAAATLLRGIDYVQVPTTLLAQVDSSVGGKVGVNHPLGKNLIGAFHPPSAVYTDPKVLSTLPRREFRSGLAELIKIAAALDRRLFTDIERMIGRLTPGRPHVLAALIARAVGLKAAVVERDERDRGLRLALNLGHTIGHAVEAASGYALRHGEAVAIGMAVEAGFARAMHVLGPEDHRRLYAVLRKAGLPVRIPRGVSRRRILAALSADKKTAGDVPRFVLLHRIGCSLAGLQVPRTFLREVLP